MSSWLLWIFIVIPGTFCCFQNDVDFIGTNLNQEHSLKTQDAETCQKMCQNNDGCFFWTWATDNYFDAAYRKDCYLKKSSIQAQNQYGTISGPKNCQPKGCCDSFKIETIGGGNFYQEERMGNYYKIGNSEDGRGVYRQQNGENYLYYIMSRGYWMIGKEIGKDLGGVLNRGDELCPENAGQLWEYWNDWQEEWRQDSNMEVNCDGNNGGNDDDKGCASGPVCDQCNIWASVNGVKYCCAQNCDYGYVEVSSENGQVVCHCYQ